MKISIITASYNSVSTLSNAMESVLHQTYTDWEYIVVDGGSTDGTDDLAGNSNGRRSLIMASMML